MNGIWTMTTESGSTYTIDYDNMRVRREQTEEERELRKDGEWLTLIYVTPVHVGSVASFMVRGANDDGVTETYRRTTPVTRLVRKPRKTVDV